MGDVVEFRITNRILVFRALREATKEVERLRKLAEWRFFVTAGYTDPEPASSDPTTRCLWEMGLIEL